jgi:hypothetical protein
MVVVLAKTGSGDDGLRYQDFASAKPQDGLLGTGASRGLLGRRMVEGVVLFGEVIVLNR